MAQLPPSKSYARIDVRFNLPDLIEVQLESFERLKNERLADLFHEISPIESYSGDMRLYFPSKTPESEDGVLLIGLKIQNTMLMSVLNAI